MRRTVRIIKGVIKGVLLAIVGVLALYSVYMLIARYAFHNEMPSFFGLSFAVVATGSMEPAISAGDVIVVCSQETYEEGDIVTYYSEDFQGYVTHRIVSKTGDAVITQGDANNTQDSPITEGDIVGKVVSVWRGFGSVVNFLQTPLGLFSVLAGGVVLWLLTDLLTGAFGKKDEQED